MGSVFYVLPLMLVLVTLLCGALYSILRAWLDYRLRIAILDKVDHNPRLLESETELGGIISSGEPVRYGFLHQNYLVTGLMMAAIGVACAVGGRVLRVGDVAVGTYIGGILCFLMGVVLALFGVVVKVLSRDPTERLSR